MNFGRRRRVRVAMAAAAASEIGGGRLAEQLRWLAESTIEIADEIATLDERVDILESGYLSGNRDLDVDDGEVDERQPRGLGAR